MLQTQPVPKSCTPGEPKVRTAKKRMLAAVEECADTIAADLGIQRGATSLWNVLERCEKYGGAPISIDRLPRRQPGIHIRYAQGNNLIFLSPYLTEDEAATVLLHELVHRLIDSPAYEPLNDAAWLYQGFDADEFNEALARAVERRFVAAGGLDIRAYLSA